MTPPILIFDRMGVSNCPRRYRFSRTKRCVSSKHRNQRFLAKRGDAAIKLEKRLPGLTSPARILSLAVPLIVAACTSLSVIVPDRGPAWMLTAADQASIPEIHNARRRLHTVAFPILRAASEFCEATKPFFGLSMAGRDNLPETIDGWNLVGGVAGVGATVLYAVPGSPADLMGLREGDVVRSSNGFALARGSEASPFLFDAAEERDAFPKQLLVRRGMVRQVVQVSPVEVCDIGVDLSVTTAAAAWARNNKLAVSHAMLKLVANEDELAFVISHEISHIILGHSTSSFGRGSAGLEREADHVGVYLMARADYDSVRGTALLLRMAEAFPLWDDGGQPSLRARYNAIAHVANGIAQ